VNTLLQTALLLSLAAPAQVVDRVAAIVNGEVVTLSELVQRAGPDYRRDDPKARAAALKSAFDLLVAEKLFAAQATALGVDVSEQVVEASIDDFKRRNKIDDTMLDELLQREGLTRDGLRQRFRRDLEAGQIMRLKVSSRVKVTDEDVKNYYQTNEKLFGGEEELKVRHIFLPMAAGAGPAEEARVRAEGEKILARLASGQDFAKVAREVSKGPSAPEGGDLGWLRRGTLTPELDRVAFHLDPGRTSGLVKTRTGYHILKVDERRVGGGKGFDEVKEEIRDRLTNEQVEAFRNQYVAELRRDALVEVRIPELKE
jgi:peptidyl-prolyl cis-trans isomerase SurA